MENLFTKNKILQIIHFQNDEKIEKRIKGRFVQGNRRFPGFLDSWKIEQNMIS
uniref:Uncharacterized protein n=1 Tax=viral metagenome TaxID=1070528 RepID=A0A6C0KI27_9ZZZZ